MTIRMATPKVIRNKSLRRAQRESVVRVPRLENGDRLTRAEFETRYRAMPNLNKAELIEGTVHMPSPVHHSHHSKPHQLINTWLGMYCASTPGVETADNGTVRLDPENIVQPDASLRLIEGGTSQITPDDFLSGAPELIVEIASTSAAYDLYDKRHVYQRNGVREYIVWQILEARVSWFVLAEGAYRELAPDAPGILRSPAFPGLWLNVNALRDGQIAKVLNDLRRGLKSKAHTAFVKQLARAARR